MTGGYPNDNDDKNNLFMSRTMIKSLEIHTFIIIITI